MIGNGNRCLFCGEALSGRPDKKYCDDNCRNNHHYQMRKDDNAVIKSVNTSLIKNREILKSLAASTKTMVMKEELVDANFNFNVMTSVYRTRKGSEYKVLYDYAYRIVNEHEVLILKYR